MIAYLIKSACCAVIFLLAYRFILAREKMHRFNRIYLLASVLLSFIIPFLGIPITESLPTIDAALPVIFVEEPPQQAIAAAANIGETVPPDTISVSLRSVIIAVYILITAFLLVRFSISLYKLVSAYASRQVIFQEGARLVIVKENINSYTFLNTIFISHNDYTHDNEILRHELAHVRQKHSLDILFIELVKIIFWFNPVYIFYKRSIQLNHEFLADQAVIQYCANPAAYQHLLLDRISLASNLSLSSRFNYSITKKRLQMMTQKNSRARAALKQFVLLPIVIACFIVFGTRTLLSASPVPAPVQATLQDTAKKKEKDIPMVEFVRPLNVPFTKEGISAQEYDEYISIQRKYLNPDKSYKENGRIFQTMTDRDKKRLESLFIRMTREQQASVTIRFMKNPGPFKKELPSEAQYEKWKNPTLYGLWINNKKVSNSELDKYSAADFSHYFASKLYGAAKKNAGYQVQVDLMTNSYYADYYKKGVASVKENPYHMIVAWGKRPA